MLKEADYELSKYVIFFVVIISSLPSQIMFPR
jgi:hypothetical protein